MSIGLAMFSVAACSDDDESISDEDDDKGTGSVYVLANEIYGDGDDSTSYLNVLRSLDVEAIDYGKAREYTGGRATIATYNGWLFVAGPEAPIVTRFSVGENGALTQDGEVSFGTYGITELVIDEWSINFISTDKAYLVNWDDGTTIIWNPATMEITGEIETPDLTRDGALLNGSAGVVRGNRLFRTFFWSNWDAYETSEEQYLAVYDVENDTLLDLVEETRCPGLGNRVSKDPEGNLYFSNWIWNVTETLVKDAPSSCALRIRADSDRFEADWVLEFPELTEGREGAMLNILDDGRALLSAFHDERATFDETTDPSELAGTDNWRLWTVDLDARTASPLDGIDWMAGAASTFVLDDRSFVFVPSGDWSRTAVFEITDGRADPAFEVRGWSFQFLKVR